MEGRVLKTVNSRAVGVTSGQINGGAKQKNTKCHHAERKFLESLERKGQLNGPVNIEVLHSNPQEQTTLPCFHCYKFMSMLCARHCRLNIHVQCRVNGNVDNYSLTELRDMQLTPSKANRKKKKN